jgi:beta propeller repeat protein
MKKEPKALRKGRNRVVVLLLVFILAVLCIPGSVTALGTETLVSTGAHDSNQETPSTWGEHIAWVDQSGGTGQIVLLNTTSGEKRIISDPVSDARSPRVQGTSVVWHEHNAGGSDIYHYDIPSGLTTRITDSEGIKVFPVVYGRKVVWQELEATDDMMGLSYYDLQMVDLDNPGQIVNITPHPDAIPGMDDVSHTNPAIWGDYVVWQNFDDATWATEIFLNDTATGTLVQLSDDGGFFSFKHHPAISGDYVVWVDDRTGDADIFMETVIPAGNTDLTPYTPSVQDMPAIHGDTVIWLDDRDHEGSHFQIGMNSLSSPAETYPISPDSRLPFTSFQSPPSVFQNRVVWQDDRNVPAGFAEIYLYTDGVPVTCPVASFTQDVTSGSSPLAVQFSDTTDPAPAYWIWDFGDGMNSTEQNPLHTFSSDGTYPVTLTVGTPACRNATGTSSGHTISAGAAPVVGFTAYPLDGLVPLTVSFTGDFSGSPASWNWSFGDGTFSEDPNPVHTYTAGGTYSVTCNATNPFGTGTLTRAGYITALTGAREIAFTNITGISVHDAGTGQQLVYDNTLLPDYTMAPDGSAFTAHPPLSYGWQNITFISGDGIGFVPNAVTITGNVSSTILTTRDILPAGFTPATGSNVRTNYQITLDGYQEPGFLITEVWEGIADSDLRNFEIVHIRSNFASMDAAYTVNTTRGGLGTLPNATINMSVGSSWLTGTRGITWGREHAYVIAMGYDADSKLKGTVFPARFTFNDTGEQLEYFDAAIPTEYTFLNKYALATLTGTGNPFQLITLTVTTHVPEPAPSSEPYSDTESDGPAVGTGAGAGKATVPVITTAATTAPTTVPTADPGTSAKIYSNGNGIVTQATRLRSADGMVTVFIGEGTVAKDAGVSPLAEITIRALPASSLPAVPAGSVFTFAGMAYEILPDGATFSPPFSLSFIIPQARWGQEYSVKTWDSRTGTWQDLPSAFDGSTGTITAEVSHLCTFALFAQPIAAPPTTAATPLQAAVVTTLPTAVPTPATAVSTFASMLSWATGLVVNNAVILAVVIVLLIAVYLGWQRRFPGAGQ